MKKYAYISDGRINQFIFIDTKGFEEIPLVSRFSEEIVRNCVEVGLEDENIKEGMDYNSKTGEFTEHIDLMPEIIADVEENVEEVEEDGEQSGKEFD